MTWVWTSITILDIWNNEKNKEIVSGVSYDKWWNENVHNWGNCNKIGLKIVYQCKALVKE